MFRKFASMNATNLQQLDDAILLALREDVGTGDHTSLATIPATAMGQARLLIKEDGILAGVEAAVRVAYHVNPALQVNVLLTDGTPVKVGDVAFTIAGKTQDITIAERLLLNIMQRMSGIATHTHRIQSMIAHTSCKLLDTRKTTPNFRFFEKWAVKIGGGENHRFGLFDMILVKDNHVDFAGGMSAAIQNVKQYLQEKNLDIPVEIEARNMADVKTIVDSNMAFRVLLDNFTPDQIR
ncbi:MAG: hypothetical protein RL062_365, partial [Bacteroidota bacterium]